MTITKIANKTIVKCVKDFYDSATEIFSAETVLSWFPDTPAHQVYAAIRMLGSEGLLNVSYADNEPYVFSLKLNAIRQCDEETWIKKGYDFVKEVKSWL